MRVALLLATALAVPPAFAQQAPDSSVTITLNPPVDQPMRLTISDRRTLPNGAAVTFSVVHHVRFAVVVDGWQATVTQQSVDCSGSASACRAFLVMMMSGNLVERRFAIARDGGVTMLPSGQGGGLGAPGSAGGNAAIIIEAAEAETPGILRAGELREALQFAGRRLEPSMICATGISGPQNIGLCGDLVIGSGDSAGISRRTVSGINLQTGLQTESLTETRISGEPANAPPISMRTWRLDRAPVPAQ
jgi:hypothetical protein